MTLESPTKWVSGCPLIAHALGEIGGRKYTNSWDGMQLAYSRGLRLFEADVALTADGVPVLIHGWRTIDFDRLGWRVPAGASPMTEEGFLSARIHGIYATMRLVDLYAFMQDHDDVRVHFDIRPQTPADTRRIYETVRGVSPSEALTARCMAGTYSGEMVDVVRRAGFFDSVNIFYHAGSYSTVSEFVSLCRAFDVETVSVNSIEAARAVVAPLRRVGVDVLYFTENVAAKAVEALRIGVAAVGTDTLSPGDIDCRAFA